MLRQNELLEVDDEGDIVNAQVQAVSNGGSAMVFATSPDSKEEGLEAARFVFEEVDEISRILEPDEYEAHGMPHPSKNEGMGDLVLEASEGHSFSDSATEEEHIISLEGTRGSHGYLSDRPQMKALFVASGRGIRSGVELDSVDNRSVAPTAAELLGLDLETADGEVLETILE